MAFNFEPEQLSSELFADNIGGAFQHFTYQLLESDHPKLHEFKAPGADGGIDLVEDLENGSRAVFECKVVSDPDKAESRWKSEVANALKEHLKDPNGPTPGQPQYAPWFSVENPIVRYAFCISSEQPRDERRQKLKQTILDCFSELAGNYPHLSHLKNIEVSVLDWSDFRNRLDKHPLLKYRWFPKTRPSGLVPLDADIKAGSFRSYLTQTKLPYYSLAEHIKHNPPAAGFSIPDEDQLLDKLEHSETSGLVIVGKGGIGKTRLMRELGFKARDKGWVVMSVTKYKSSEALQQFIADLNQDSKVLLLIDYVETLEKFAQLTQDIIEEGSTAGVKLRYIATCRTGYYNNAIVNVERHERIDLTQLSKALNQWFETYRKHSVKWILDHNGLLDDDRYLDVCKNSPILAVFASYLNARHRTDDLNELLTVGEFGAWIRNRIAMSFKSDNVGEDLAMLIPLFPLPDNVAVLLDRKSKRPLFYCLLNDGWIEKIESDASASDPILWMTAHDVLADQILLSYLQTIPETVEWFVKDLLDFAKDMNCLNSVIISLGRIAGNPPLVSLDWKQLLPESISDSALSYKFGLDTGGEKELSQESIIDWYIRQPYSLRTRYLEDWTPTSTRDKDKHKEQCEEIEKLLSISGDLVEAGLLFRVYLEANVDKELVRQRILHWLSLYEFSSDARHVYTAWLNAGGETELVRDFIRNWLSLYGESLSAGFLYNAWLNAGGDKELVRESVRDWLELFKDSKDAVFIFWTWLHTGGEKELVRESIREWLIYHKVSPEASFIYREWLESGGEKELIWDAALEWIERHKLEEDAIFVIKYLSNQQDLPSNAVISILEWCRTFPTNEDTLWRLVRLRGRLVYIDVIEETIKTMAVVLERFFELPDFITETTKNQLTIIFSFLNIAARDNIGDCLNEINELFIKWLRYPASFGPKPVPHKFIQRAAFVWRIETLLDSGQLDLIQDREPLQRFMAWFGTWEDENKQRAARILDRLRENYPAPDLWGIEPTNLGKESPEEFD